MRNFILLCAFLIGMSASAQQSQVQTSIDSLIPDNTAKAVTPARLRVAFQKVLNFIGLNTPDTPEKFGAKGDGVTNDLAAFQAWINANSSGKIRIPAKTYNIIGTLVISKGAAGTSKLEIDATGAKIITGNASTVPVLRFSQTKNLTVTGLTVDGLTDYDGVWYSDFVKCKFQVSKFGFTNAGTFDEFYRNTWSRCDFKEIWINTGTSLDKTEFNSNAFYDCNIWQSDYAIRVFGNQLLQGFYFYNCDVSYQFQSMLYVDEPVLDSTLFSLGVIGILTKDSR